jgi:hypothetical protein
MGISKGIFIDKHDLGYSTWENSTKKIKYMKNKYW